MPTTRLSVQLLGAPRIVFDGAPVSLDTRKAVALLAYLAVSDQRHTRDALAALLWPEYDQRRSRAALRRTLSTLKAAVEGYGLAIERETLGMDPQASFQVDVRLFGELLAACRAHGHPVDSYCPDCLAPLTQAVDLYQGDFMTGFSLRDSVAFDDWQYLQGEALRRELATALRGLLACHQERADYETAIPLGLRLLELDPLHEPAHRQLMILYASAGQRALALRQYRDCIRVLDEELGVAPLAETTSLYEEILGGKFEETALKYTGPKAGTVPEPGLAQSGVSSPSQVIEAPSYPAQQMPLVGRSSEWTAMVDWYNSVEADGHLLVLEGEAGVGKTRLAQSFLEHVKGQGAETITAQCYEGESGLAYAPFAEALTAAVRTGGERDWSAELQPYWLAEASRLVPELLSRQSEILSLPAQTALEGPGAQNRFFEAICQLLIIIGRGSRASVLFLDDLHWADEASLDLLSYLVRRLVNRPLFVLVTWRGEQLSSGHRLQQMLGSAQRQGLVRHLTLGRLDEAAVFELVGMAADQGGDMEELGHHLYRETEGLPFFLVEYLATLGMTTGDIRLPDLPPTPGLDVGSPLPMPRSVRDLLSSRLATVSETGRQLLHTAAVIGRSFDFDILREASGRGEEETVTALEELLAHGLVIEHIEIRGTGDASSELSAIASAASVPIYDFSHEKLRTVAYEETSLARRRLLHRRVGQALMEKRPVLAAAGRGPTVAAQVGYHFQRAGLEAEAAGQYKLAGDEAKALYANTEALAHYQTALALGGADTVGLHEAIGDLHTLRGEYNEALANYESAAALIEPATQRGLLAQLETKLGGVYHRRGDWDLAALYYQQAFGRAADDSQRARLLSEWSLTVHQAGDSERALELAERAIVLAQSAGDQQALAQAHNLMGILASNRGDLVAASQHLQESLELAEELDDPVVKIAALNNLSLARRSAGDTERAIELVERALAMCVEVGDRHREAALHNNLADLLHASNQSEATMVHLKQAVAIYAEIGGQAGDWRPEIWKLTEW